MRFSPGGCCESACLCCKDGSKLGYLKLILAGVGSPKCPECNSLSAGYISGSLSTATCHKFTNNDLGWPSALYSVGDDMSACDAGILSFPWACNNYYEVVGGEPSGPHAVNCTIAHLFVVWNATKQKRGLWFYSIWDDVGGGIGVDPWPSTILQGWKAESASEPYNCNSLSNVSLTVSGSILGCSGTITLKVSSQATP